MAKDQHIEPSHHDAAKAAAPAAKGNEKLTGGQVMHKATEILHSTVEPIPAVLIADTLATLKGAITAGPKKEPPPKNLEEAISKIDELVGKIDPPLENKPDFKAILESAKAEPPPKVEATVAPDQPGEAKAS